MLQYLFELIIWTMVLYGLILLIKLFIFKFIISKEKIEELKNRGFIKKEKYIKYNTKSGSKNIK